MHFLPSIHPLINTENNNIRFNSKSLNPFHFIFSNPFKPSFFYFLFIHLLIFCLVLPKNSFFEKRKKRKKNGKPRHVRNFFKLNNPSVCKGEEAKGERMLLMVFI
jgi:hypothetical protein